MRWKRNGVSRTSVSPGRASGCTYLAWLSGGNGVHHHHSPPSRFIDELPAELIDWRRDESEVLARRTFPRATTTVGPIPGRAARADTTTVMPFGEHPASPVDVRVGS